MPTLLGDLAPMSALDRSRLGWRALALSILAVSVVALGILAPSGRAGAQDVRDIRPSVMLLVDTSGSMERLPSCQCSTPACDNCYPTCQPDGSGNVARNKWHTVLEALTGSWNNFSCQEVARPATGYDADYPIPHFSHPPLFEQNTDGVVDLFSERVLFGLMTFDAQPTWDGQPAILPTAEWLEAESNGAAGHYSYGPAQGYGFPGCQETEHRMNNGARSEASSVGPLISVGTTGTEHNERVQAALLGDGLRYDDLRPFGATPVAGLLSDLAHYMQTSPDVQLDPLGACRPRYAILLTDGQPNADMRESPFNCEVRQPDNPFGCPYDRPEEIVASLCGLSGSQCGGDLDGVFVVGFDIDDASTRARLNELADLGGTGEAVFAASAQELQQELVAILNRVAVTVTSRTAPVFMNGPNGVHAQYNSGFRQTSAGPWEGILEQRRFECDTHTQLPEPQTVTDADRFHLVISRQAQRTLWTALPSNRCHVRSHITGPWPEDISPISAGGGSTGGNGGGNTGQGGRNTQCRTSNNPRDREVQCPVPAVDPDDTNFTSSCGSNGNGGGNNNTPTGPLDSNVQRVEITNSINRSFFFASTNAERDAIVGWLHGQGRANALGAILHSTPVVVTAPNQDIADESYNIWRRRPAVANRPAVLYVGTNDGILHAISAEAQEVTRGAQQTRIPAGEELWGFVPPALFPSLRTARLAPRPMLDGTPMVRDVFLRRAPGEDPEAVADRWRTILITGFRQGGPGYVALDVTNPLEPRFMWQFSDPNMGATFGTPAVAQIVVRLSDGSLEERAIVLLPGGDGEDVSASLGCGKCYVCNGVPQLETPTVEQIESGQCVHSEPIGCNNNGAGTPPANNGTIQARENQTCWGTRGRQLYIVDPATGQLIDSLGDSVFGAPLVGGMTVFPGEPGTIATAAYTTDADGRIWRIDISNPDLSQWSASSLFDMFWNEGATDGQPAFESPLVTTDPLGNVVILQATGNIDVFDHFVRNKVVSITERFSVTPQTAGSTNVNMGAVGADLNWQLTLRPSEQVTGPMTLFAGQVFFGTFTGMPDQDNACAQGQSRIWGVHYINTVSPNAAGGDGDASGTCVNIADPANSGPQVHWPVGALRDMQGTDGAGRCVGPIDNVVVMGVSVAQRTTCVAFDADPTENDPYLGTTSTPRPSSASGGVFELVAQSSGSTQAAPGGMVSDTSYQMPTPLQFTRATSSYAGRAD